MIKHTGRNSVKFDKLAQNNTLIGIISHVADLKERINRQIVVKKSKDGGSRVEVVTE